jgi:hypothetical protein
MSWDVDEKEFYETFAEIESERGIEEAKRWAWSALDWTQKELRKKEEGVKDERAAVVAYLRELGEINSMLSPMKGAADDIECGEHRSEEEEPLVGFDGTPVKVVMAEGPSGLFIGTDRLIVSTLKKDKVKKKK